MTQSKNTTNTESPFYCPISRICSNEQNVVLSYLLLSDQKWRQPLELMLNSSSSIWKPTACPATVPLFSALLQSKKQCLTDCVLCLSFCLILVTCCTATSSLAIRLWEILHDPSWKIYAPCGFCQQSIHVAANQFPRFHWDDNEISGVVRQPVESQAWPGKAEMQFF